MKQSFSRPPKFDITKWIGIIGIMVFPIKVLIGQSGSDVQVSQLLRVKLCHGRGSSKHHSAMLILLTHVSIDDPKIRTHACNSVGPKWLTSRHLFWSSSLFLFFEAGGSVPTVSISTTRAGCWTMVMALVGTAPGAVVGASLSWSSIRQSSSSQLVKKSSATLSLSSTSSTLQSPSCPVVEGDL